MRGQLQLDNTSWVLASTQRRAWPWMRKSICTLYLHLWYSPRAEPFESEFKNHFEVSEEHILEHLALNIIPSAMRVILQHIVYELGSLEDVACISRRAMVFGGWKSRTIFCIENTLPPKQEKSVLCIGHYSTPKQNTVLEGP